MASAGCASRGRLRLGSLLAATLAVLVGCGAPGSSALASSSPRPAARGVTPGPVWASRRYESPGYAAAALADGRILLTGGQVPSEVDAACQRATAAGQVCLPPVTATAELYDPVTATFSPTGPMTEARRDHRAVTLPDGRVLVVGGLDDVGFPLGTAEVYDPASGTFAALGALDPATEVDPDASPDARRQNALDGQTVVVLTDGRVLIAGGTDSRGTVSNLALILDPESGQFGRLSSLPAPWTGGSASVLPSGTVLLTNGFASPTGEPTDRTVVFDPGMLSFAPGPRTVVRRAGSSATVLLDGRVLLVDGMVDPFDELPNCGSVIPAELFDPAVGAFATVRGRNPSWPVTSVRAADGAVLLLGGTKPDCTALREVEAFVPGVDTVEVVATGLLPDGLVRDAFALADGTFLLLTDEGLRFLSLD